MFPESNSFLSLNGKEMQTLIRIFIALISLTAYAQNDAPKKPDKVSHAEPISFDLIRDLGARKGEQEWNVGLGMTSVGDRTLQSFFIEYEFAPVNRLGLELELPLHFSDPSPGTEYTNGFEGIKAAVQYSFLVSPKAKMTLAAGYIFELCPKIFQRPENETIHVPFFIVAKKWGQVNALLLAAPSLTISGSKREAIGLVNTSLHYIIPGTKNFIGIELNSELAHNTFHLMIRPQTKIILSNTLALGMAAGFSGGSSAQKMDFMMRWIYEPAKNKSRK